MRYLVLSADYYSFLQDEFNEDFDYLELGLPKDLVERLEDWHNNYLPIVPMDKNERLSAGLVIAQLDIEGVNLAKEIKSALGDIKISYYSEGLLKKLYYLIE
jgi:hypothetical protein